jgi:hypothetical protein
VKAHLHLRLSSSIVVLALGSLVSLASAGCASMRGPQDSSLSRPYRDRFIADDTSSRNEAPPRSIEASKDHSREAVHSWH